MIIKYDTRQEVHLPLLEVVVLLPLKQLLLISNFPNEARARDGDRNFFEEFCERIFFDVVGVDYSRCQRLIIYLCGLCLKHFFFRYSEGKYLV
jgi:hypothetical protein